MSSQPSSSDIQGVLDNVTRQTKANDKIMEIREDPNTDKATMTSIDADWGKIVTFTNKITAILRRLRLNAIWETMASGGTVTYQEWNTVCKDYEALYSSVNDFNSILDSVLGGVGLSMDDFSA